MNELIYQPRQYLFTYHTKCHPKNYHSGINYHITLNIMFSVVVRPRDPHSGVHSLLYFAYTCVRDLCIGGVIYVAKRIIR